MSDSAEKGEKIAELEDATGAADKTQTSDAEKPTLTEGPSRVQPPAWLASMTQEERDELEKKLKRKIDIRLMPAIIIMYILNYIDR